MNALNELLSEGISDLGNVTALARAPFEPDAIRVEIATKPHKARLRVLPYFWHRSTPAPPLRSPNIQQAGALSRT